jgi:hypothetical protein
MPTLVTALTLVSLVKLSHLDYKPWELSCLFAVILGVVLWGGALGWFVLDPLAVERGGHVRCLHRMAQCLAGH